MERQPHGPSLQAIQFHQYAFPPETRMYVRDAVMYVYYSYGMLVRCTEPP